MCCKIGCFSFDKRIFKTKKLKKLDLDALVAQTTVEFTVLPDHECKHRRL